MSKRQFVDELNEIPESLPEILRGIETNIHATVTMGEPGHTMVKDENGNWIRALNHGGIKIGDRVHIGENSVIKRATLPKIYTSIGNDSKICSFVNVGHNCKIGKNVFIGPHVCLNGSVTIHDGAWIAGHAVIGQHAIIEEGATVGMGAVVPPREIVPAGKIYVGSPARPIEYLENSVALDFIHGDNFKIGKHCVIEEGVVVGNNCTVKNYVELRKGTIIGDDCYIDSRVSSSGNNRIGNRVTIRYSSILAKGVVLEDDVFISPQFMSENLNHLREPVGGAYIERGVFIGTNVTTSSGIKICEGAVIGTKANVRKSIIESGVYVGNPARKIQ
ncbi:MAG TPA: DapH/DapD/GlmU-related protein [Dehalococcoidia bacterium]|nr:DapH/DapD/GlmU-related protein [Dehalococcoidia bacterium]